MNDYNKYIQSLDRNQLLDESIKQIDTLAEDTKCKLLMSEWIKRDGNMEQYKKAWHCCMDLDYNIKK